MFTLANALELCDVLVEIAHDSDLPLLGRITMLRELAYDCRSSDGPYGLSCDQVVQRYFESHYDCEKCDFKRQIRVDHLEVTTVKPFTAVADTEVEKSEINVKSESTVADIFEELVGVPADSFDPDYEGGANLEMLAGIVPDLAVDGRGDMIGATVTHESEPWLGGLLFDTVFGAGSDQTKYYGCPGCANTLECLGVCTNKLEGYEFKARGIPGLQGYGAVAVQGMLLGVFPVLEGDPSVAYSFARCAQRTPVGVKYLLFDSLGPLDLRRVNLVPTWRPDITNAAISRKEHGFKKPPLLVDFQPSVATDPGVGAALVTIYDKYRSCYCGPVADGELWPKEKDRLKRDYLVVFQVSHREYAYSVLGDFPSVEALVGCGSMYRLLGDLRYYKCTVDRGVVVGMNFEGIDCLSESFLAEYLRRKRPGTVLQEACWLGNPQIMFT